MNNDNAQTESQTSLLPVLELMKGKPQDSFRLAFGAAKDDPCGTSAEKKKKKKKVCFGGPLSPELFDKKLPPSTPLQKGGTPVRAPTPGGALRSVLKTPQRIESDTSPAQPDFSSPGVFGASPLLAMSRKSRITSDEKDSEERKVVKIHCPEGETFPY